MDVASLTSCLPWVPINNKTTCASFLWANSQRDTDILKKMRESSQIVFVEILKDCSSEPCNFLYFWIKIKKGNARAGCVLSANRKRLENQSDLQFSKRMWLSLYQTLIEHNPVQVALHRGNLLHFWLEYIKL